MKIISCKFNMDTAYVELRLGDDMLITIDIITVKDEAADQYV